MIHVLATIELRPGTRESFLAEFRKVVGPVRDEEGCLEYGAAVDVPATLGVTAANRPDVVVVVEKWASLAALQAHLVAPHMQAYRPKVKDFVERVSLQVLEPVT